MPDATSLAPAPPATSGIPAVRHDRRRRRGIRLLLLYGLALALVAFWPVPVDRGAEGLLRTVSQTLPWLSYEVIETSANVALFVPLGVLLALALPGHRGLVLPLALLATLVIESGQAIFLAQRTPSLRDVVANVLGAGIGLVIILLAERRLAAPR